MITIRVPGRWIPLLPEAEPVYDSVMLPFLVVFFLSLVALGEPAVSADLEREESSDVEDLLTRAVATRDASDIVELALVYRERRVLPLVRALLDPLAQRDPALWPAVTPSLVDHLAAAAELLDDSSAVVFLWRHVTRAESTISPAIRRAVLVLARPEHIEYVGYSLDDDNLAVAQLADLVLRRIGSPKAIPYLRNAIAVRRTWLITSGNEPGTDYADVARTHALVRQHTETMGLLGDRSVAPALRSRLADRTAGNRAAAARALARLRDPSWRVWAQAELHEAPSDQPADIERIVAAELLAAHGDPVGRDLLIGWLYAPDDRIVMEALCGLVRLATAEAKPGLVAWRKVMPDSPHRALSALALCASGDRSALEETWHGLLVLRSYDIYRDPPIRPDHVLRKAMGWPPDRPWPAPPWAPMPAAPAGS